MAKKRFYHQREPSLMKPVKHLNIDYLISCMAIFIHAGHICISASEKENTRFLLMWKCYPASSAAFFYLV